MLPQYATQRSISTLARSSCGEVLRCRGRFARSEQFGGSYAERPAQSVEATNTNWSFGAMWQPNPAPCLLAALSASVLEDSIAILDEFFGREGTGTQNARGQFVIMLYTLLHSIKNRRARAMQKRNALHMMALSGVIRPSQVELRYGTPLRSLPALWQPTKTETSLPTKQTPARAWHREVQAIGKQIRQWVLIASKTMTQPARKLLSPQWNAD
jgi:hypothetical protein